MRHQHLHAHKAYIMLNCGAKRTERFHNERRNERNTTTSVCVVSLLQGHGGPGTLPHYHTVSVSWYEGKLANKSANNAIPSFS